MRTGRRDGLLELLRRRAHVLGPGPDPGRVGCCQGAALSSSQRKEQRKMAGSAGRPRRGDAPWEVEAEATEAAAEDSSMRRQGSKPGDFLMKVS